MAVPSLAGESLTVTPHSRSFAILEVAVPWPPEMMAPACPMRRPGGAVRPAMKETTWLGLGLGLGLGLAGDE